MRATYFLPACVILAACNGGGVHSNVVMGGAPALGQSTAFLLDGDPAGNYGEAFMDADGKGFIVVGPSDGQPAQALYRFDGDTVQRSPGALTGTVNLNQSSTMTLRTSAVAPGQLAGSYTVQWGGLAADFKLDADGKLTAAGGACQLSGAVQASGGVPGTLPVTLTISGCTAEGKYDGYLIRSADYAPGAFRLVADDGKRIIDGYAISNGMLK
ncbi:hypothetical protein GCM10027277_12620 [Pseudoduganella ginsengisoli]|uniref:Lipoprotein n=1 Tax=Pseudoduganella ginsengisoli TaxID=1462440 RepID=A0A6L6PWY8_9BURK|nr:hypothetical protein [Pseudoduganella ginsengisoli]MTW01651.1 hypothetical protein [Pseudoduganella ginsengisoli]